MFNHFGITNLYFSKEKTKSANFFYVHNCVVFMDALNLVAHDIPCLRVVLNNRLTQLFICLAI